MDFSKFTCDELKNFMKEAAKALEKKDEQMDGAYDKAYNAIVEAVKEYMHKLCDLVDPEICAFCPIDIFRSAWYN